MSVPENDKELLDGILLHAAKNQLSLIRVRRKSDGKEITLLCCNETKTEGNTCELNIVPVAELTLGTDLAEYEFPAELTPVVQVPAQFL